MSQMSEMSEMSEMNEMNAMNEMNEQQFDLLAMILPNHREEECRTALRDIPGAVFLQLHGVGTANSTVLEILGLDDNEMIVAFVVLRHEDAQTSLLHLGESLNLFKPGKGIAFVLPIERYLGLISIFEAIQALQTKSRPLQSKWQEFKTKILPSFFKKSRATKEKTINEISKATLHMDQELILAILNEDHAHEAIHQMRSLGVRGGTILPASGRGKHADSCFLGMELVPEKEILLMVVPAVKSQSILEYLYHEGELSTPGSGIAFSLPVDYAIGLSTVRENESTH